MNSKKVLCSWGICAICVLMIGSSINPEFSKDVKRHLYEPVGRLDFIPQIYVFTGGTSMTSAYFGSYSSTLLV